MVFWVTKVKAYKFGFLYCCLVWLSRSLFDFAFGCSSQCGLLEYVFRIFCDGLAEFWFVNLNSMNNSSFALKFQACFIGVPLI